MILYDFCIVLENQITEEQKKIMFTSTAGDYRAAWEEATWHAWRELQKNEKHYYIKSINHIL